MTMTKQYRQELRVQKQMRRDIERGLSSVLKSATNQIAAIHKNVTSEEKAAKKHFQRINRRIAVLEGRLA